MIALKVEVKMGKRIGIPKALLYYKYYPFWKTFLEGLGCEVVTSSPTTQKILQDGVRHTVDEVCLPVKVFCGHVLGLVEAGVDYLFIPRIESVEPGHFVCTKFLGLPDIVRNSIDDIPPILSPNIDLNRRYLYQSMFSTGWKITKNPIKIHSEYRRARKAQLDFEERLPLARTPAEVFELIDKDLADDRCAKTGKTEEKRDLNIALMGHPYNVYDSFINLGIIKKLERMGANVVTQEMAPYQESVVFASRISGDLYWTYGKELLGASLFFLKEKIDGIIFVISFPCGPDSLIVEYATRLIRNQVSTLSLVIDEHQAEVGITTRLESFVDLVRMRKRKGAN